MTAKPARVTEEPPQWGVAALDGKRDAVRWHQAAFAARRQRWIDANQYFYSTLARVLRFIIEPRTRVLHVRCQTGFMLEALDPGRGMGVDVSEEMIGVARARHPRFDFRVTDPEDLELDEYFDYILFDNVNDTVDVLAALRRLKPLCEARTRLVICAQNHLWQPIFELAEHLALKMPMPEPNWLSEADLRNLLSLAGFEWLRTHRVVLAPLRIPLLSDFFNRFVAKLPGVRKLCMMNVLVARPLPVARTPDDVSVSVVVPCKNEEGNIAAAAARIPEMGRKTEIVFCDDKSTDNTLEEMKKAQAMHADREIVLVQGPGICKSENVWAGFQAARGDILMILDGDLAVMPEELQYFFHAIVEGRGEFINGSRMVYPTPKAAMKRTNMVGNKLFSIVFSFLLDQTIKDTLCGTKVFWRSDWERIRPLVGTWGAIDRWGDYELLFGAAKLHLRIVDMPVHYQERLYGTTKMVRVFRNGLIMLRMCLAGFVRLKQG